MHLHVKALLQGGKYRIEKVLGQGGFGITYLATQVALGRKVAIKEFFMKEYCERDGETSHVSLGTSGSRETVERFRTKFIKEAQTIAGLNHPHIIRIHDIFEENGTAYYVMEYWDNGSLADYVKSRGKLSETEALRYIRQVADALGYIHERKMNHLDVKPGNILLDANKNAVLIDFGLSKRYDAEGNQTSTTPVGISHGYTPLEQYYDGGVSAFSPEADIYSLGATLYQLVTGEKPPRADDVFNSGLPIMPNHLSISTVSAITEAMRPKCKERPATVAAFMTMLESGSNCVNDGDEATVVVESVEPAPRPVPVPTYFSWKKWVVLLSSVFVVILAGVFGWGIKDNDSEGKVEIVDKPRKPQQPTKPVIQQAEPANSTPGRLTVTTLPSEASVYVDGDKVGNTPLVGMEIARGIHTVILYKYGYKSFSKKIYFGDGPVNIHEVLDSEDSSSSKVGKAVDLGLSVK